MIELTKINTAQIVFDNNDLKDYILECKENLVF